ncbi:type VII secretion protein EccB [Mycobacterium asiaticum]|uniref:type VII secretion protein EccB n=1 Tax=Mycobacterium asiaticum TaxID=1790 RepID=UPI000AA47280|nr:type VII secretion protein EccB [Mycobacterium asiaticum]
MRLLGQRIGGAGRLDTTTWLHVSAYRYRRRRLERALLGGDHRAVVRSRRIALVLGAVLSAVALAATGLMGCLRPQLALSDAPIAMGQVSGALYVRVGDTWHPVPNLASARLIAGTDANPRPVRESDLARAKRGPSLGILGAPQQLSPALPAAESVWTVCDGEGDAGTTVLVGPPAGTSEGALGADRAFLVATDPGAQPYLFYRGSRALVDLTDHAVVRALNLSGQTPRIVSPTLLSAVPEVPAIAVPRIPQAGGPPRAWLPGIPVGTVLRITPAGGEEHYVVLADGVQRIGQVAADLLRFGDAQGSVNAVTVAPDALRNAPIVDGLPTAAFPERAPVLDMTAVVCAVWTPARSGPAGIALVAGSAVPLRAGEQPASLAQADGRGPAVDAVQLPPGRSAFVSAQPLTGTSPRSAPRFLVTESGVRFAVADDEAAHDLGLPTTPAPAPWAVLAALPCGPELSRAKASVGRDTLAP